jgi:hypothetical protein
MAVPVLPQQFPVLQSLMQVAVAGVFVREPQEREAPEAVVLAAPFPERLALQTRVVGLVAEVPTLA